MPLSMSEVECGPRGLLHDDGQRERVRRSERDEPTLLRRLDVRRGQSVDARLAEGDLRELRPRTCAGSRARAAAPSSARSRSPSGSPSGSTRRVPRLTVILVEAPSSFVGVLQTWQWETTCEITRRTVGDAARRPRRDDEQGEPPRGRRRGAYASSRASSSVPTRGRRAAPAATSSSGRGWPSATARADARTSVASMRTANASPSPNCCSPGTLPTTKPANDAAITSAAAVISVRCARARTRRPRRCRGRASHASRIRETRNTS